MERFPDNARVCFVGDSITHNNRYVSRIIDEYFTQFPDCNIKFYNCGAASSAVADMNIFFDDFVLSRKPTHIISMFGINDSKRWLLVNRCPETYDGLMAAFEDYKKQYEIFYEKTVQHNINFTVCTPPPYAEYQENGNEPLHGGFALMQMYSDFVREFAKKHELNLVDMHAYLTRCGMKEELFAPDRIHPNDKGHYRMAEYMLSCQNIKIKDEAPIPQYLDAWRTETAKLSYIYMAEVMVIKGYALPFDEKIKKADEFIKNPSSQKEAIPCAKMFLENYPQKAEIEKKIIEMTEAGLQR